VPPQAAPSGCYVSAGLGEPVTKSDVGDQPPADRADPDGHGLDRGGQVPQLGRCYGRSLFHRTHGRRGAGSFALLLAQSAVTNGVRMALRPGPAA